MGRYDRTIKLLVDSNPEAIARLVQYVWQKQEPGRWPDLPITSVTQLSTEFHSEERDADTALLVEGAQGPLYLLQMEVQSQLDPFMPLRSLEYCVRARRKHWKEYGDLPLIAAVLYLFDDARVPEPPLRWLAPDGQITLVFWYLPIRLKSFSREELLALHEPELWPLVLLTEGPVDRIIVREMFAEVLEHKAYRTLPICHTIASWLLRGDDQAWLHQEYEKMMDLFQDAPAIQWMEADATKRVTRRITEQVTEQVTAQVTEQVRREERQRALEEREQALKEERRRALEERERALKEERRRALEERERERALEERERRRMLEEQKKALDSLRQVVSALVAQRFPEQERFARAQVRLLHRPESFQQLTRHLAAAHDAREVIEILFSIPEEEEAQEGRPQ